MNNIMDNIVVFIIIQTLLIATPIMITAVGACICELTGVTNIGLEGIMLSGAFAAAANGCRRPSSRRYRHGLAGSAYHARTMRRRKRAPVVRPPPDR